MTARDVAKFFIDDGDGLFVESQLDELEKVIQTHIDYGTILVLADKGEIIAAVRWNWVNDHEVEALDAVVNRKYRRRGIISILVRMSLNRNPKCSGVFYQNKDMTKTFFRPTESFFHRRIENVAATTQN